MKQNTDAATVVENTTKGDTFTVEYESAHSADNQTLTGDVLEAGESWNGEVLQVEFKNSDGVYRVSVEKDGGAVEVERLQYDWQNGERVKLTGHRRIRDKNGDVVNMSVEGVETPDVGDVVELTGDVSHHNLGKTWGVLTANGDNITLTDERGVDTLTVSPDQITVV
jgi:hypothetical protein